MQFGLIGNPLGHSYSAEIHRLIEPSFDYECRELQPGDLSSFFQAKQFDAVNVTIPYKQDVIPFLDEISPLAKRIGAVNTIVNRGGTLCGYNTDFDGLKALIGRVRVDVRGKKAIVLGTGGTSRTAVVVLEALGANPIFRVSRTGKEGALTYEELIQSHADAQILLNTTPCGMDPDCMGLPVDLSVFSRLEAVVDAIYHPLRTRLVLEAQARGIPAVGGLYMLVSQAVAGASIFHGKTYPEGLADAVYDRMARAAENLILIGLPGVGKTTVGKAVAKRLGRAFVDLDGLITEQTGRTPAQIILENGETAFRAIETQTVQTDLIHLHGAVIALGGGTVLKRENAEMLKQNGRFYLLNRPIASIEATSDRPLSSNRALLEKLAVERASVYRETAQMTIDASAGIKQTVLAICEDWNATKKEKNG